MTATHGHSLSVCGAKSLEYKTYRSWKSMLERCSNPKSTGWKNYGGRGITVCSAWLESYENFLADMGVKPTEKHTLDRIENDGNYEPGNCRWATKIVQAKNTRRNQRVLFRGKLEDKTELAERFGVNARSFMARLNRGWDVWAALNTPYKRGESLRTEIRWRAGRRLRTPL